MTRRGPGAEGMGSGATYQAKSLGRGENQKKDFSLKAFTLSRGIVDIWASLMAQR